MIENIQQTAILFTILSFVSIVLEPDKKGYSIKAKTIILGIFFMSSATSIIGTIIRIWS